MKRQCRQLCADISMTQNWSGVMTVSGKWPEDSRMSFCDEATMRSLCRTPLQGIRELEAFPTTTKLVDFNSLLAFQRMRPRPSTFVS